MYTKSVQTILSRAMNEPEFADELFANPRKALSAYHLTSDEIILFEGMSRAEFKAMAAEERKSFGIKVHDAPDGVNHNQSALKVSKGTKINHNQSALKIVKGLKNNHNQYALKAK